MIVVDENAVESVYTSGYIVWSPIYDLAIDPAKAAVNLPAPRVKFDNTLSAILVALPANWITASSILFLDEFVMNAISVP